VRNITDVGHLENETLGEGEDRIEKKARQEQIEPMESCAEICEHLP